MLLEEYLKHDDGCCEEKEHSHHKDCCCKEKEHSHHEDCCCKEKEHSHHEDCCCDKKSQTHTHEFLGSTKIAEKKEDPHNHRFAGVTGEAIPTPCGHIHKLKTNTDFYENHFHMICDETGPAIPVCEGRHVHFVKGCTTEQDGHKHEFIFATLIDNPIGD